MQCHPGFEATRYLGGGNGGEGRANEGKLSGASCPAGMLAQARWSWLAPAGAEPEGGSPDQP